jgi:predicted HAD superfamily Cof-like phosphohydrolase
VAHNSRHALTAFQSVRQFHAHVGHPIGTRRPTDQDRLAFRAHLIDEEARELQGAIYFKKAPAILSECVDVVYVVLGLCVEMGWDFDEAFNRIHAANMTKIPDPNGHKAHKPANFIPANVDDLAPPNGWCAVCGWVAGPNGLCGPIICVEAERNRKNKRNKRKAKR